MLKQLASVRASDLEQALLILPFSDALRLLSYFCTWLERGAEVSCHLLCPPCTSHGPWFPPKGKPAEQPPRLTSCLVPVPALLLLHLLRLITIAR